MVWMTVLGHSSHPRLQDPQELPKGCNDIHHPAPLGPTASVPSLLLPGGPAGRPPTSVAAWEQLHRAQLEVKVASEKTEKLLNKVLGSESASVNAETLLSQAVEQLRQAYPGPAGDQGSGRDEPGSTWSSGRRRLVTLYRRSAPLGPAGPGTFPAGWLSPSEPSPAVKCVSSGCRRAIRHVWVRPGPVETPGILPSLPWPEVPGRRPGLLSGWAFGFWAWAGAHTRTSVLVVVQCCRGPWHSARGFRAASSSTSRLNGLHF